MATSIVALASLCMVSMDVFALWTFWNHYEIDTGAYVAAFLLLIATVFIGWFLFNLLVAWQAHSLSTAGSSGSNRVLPRRQLLADQTVTDACSGNIAKHHHFALVTGYFAADGCSICSACRVGDGRRAAALLDQPNTSSLSCESIISACAGCDAHEFLVTAKKADDETETAARQRISKATLIDISYALALPDRHSETSQLHTRVGASKEEGQIVYNRQLCFAAVLFGCLDRFLRNWQYFFSMI